MFLNHKRYLAIIMCAIMIFGMFSSVYAAPSSWAEEFVKSMLLEGLASDEILTSADLQKNITREEFAELTVRLYAKAKGVDVADLVEWNPFYDTDNTMVAKAYNIGIVSGTGLDSRDRKLFSPNNLVTRQEIAVMLVKELDILNKNVDPKYSLKFSDDSTISSWAYDAVAFATEDGIISGVGDNKVAPRAYASREQALVLINKIAVKYKWIDNKAKTSLFNYSNASKSFGFWVPKDTASDLRSQVSTSGVKFIVSHILDTYTPDIKKQQTDLINILVNSDVVSYDALITLRPMILNGYDGISKTYNTSSKVYINVNTGAISTKVISKPYISFEVNSAINLEYLK